MSNNGNNDNPYAVPRAKVVEAAHAPAAPGEDRLLETPAVAPAAAGRAWVSESWQLFRRAPGPVILILVVYIGVLIAAGLIPLLGDVFTTVTFAFWSAAWAMIADKLYRHEKVGVGDLFAGFAHRRAGTLLAVGFAYFGLMLAVVAVTVLAALVMFGWDVITQIDSMNPADFIFQIMLLVAVAIVGLFFVIAATIYAPLLVAFHDVELVRACGLSLRAVLRNWLSLTVAGLLFIGLGLACLLTLGLGFLVLLPMMWLVQYVSYRRIFLEGGE